MKSKNVKRLMDMYENCPICGSNKIETKGNKLISGIVINSNTFKRVCRCGFNIEIKEQIKNKGGINYMIDRKSKIIIIIYIICITGLVIIQATSGWFESQSPESKILEIIEEQIYIG